MKEKNISKQENNLQVGKLNAKPRKKNKVRTYQKKNTIRETPETSKIYQI